MALIVALVILAIGMMFDLPLLTIIGGAAVLWIGFARLALSLAARRHHARWLPHSWSGSSTFTCTKGRRPSSETLRPATKNMAAMKAHRERRGTTRSISTASFERCSWVEATRA